MKITALVFDGVMSSDVLAPIEAVSGKTEVTTRLASPSPGTNWGFEPLHCFAATDGVDQTWETDLLLVPGGLGSIAMMRETDVTGWLHDMAESSQYIMSVSTGSLLLAAAGLLDQRDASGHWLAHDDLAAAGAHPTIKAVSWQGNIVTTSGYLSAAEVARTIPDRLVYDRT
jgi:putative intracellular protease/amidase